MMRWQHYNFGGRALWVRPVNLDVLQANNIVAASLSESLSKSPPWAVGFFFGNLELSMELWTVIAGISGFDD
jgi:hypothetical protein